MHIKKFILKHNDVKLSEFKKKFKVEYANVVQCTSNLPLNTPLRQRFWHILNDTIDIPKCKMCHNEVSWNRSKKKYCEYCSNQCRSNNKNLLKKTKQTNLKKYGVAYPLQSKEIKKKQENTTLERHGVTNAAKLDIFKEKAKQTNLEKYGVTCIFQDEAFKEIIKQTMLKKHGVEYAMQSDEFKEIAKRTMLKKYGVEYAMQSDEFKEKAKLTNLEKYGVEYTLQAEEIKEKTKQTNLEKYGVESTSQIHISQDSLMKLNNREWLIEHHHNEQLTLTKIGEILGVHSSTVAQKCADLDIRVKYFSFSMGEKEVLEFVTEILPPELEILANDRKVIAPYELDIYIPAFNFAIEYNGEYWHSNSHKKDILKYEMCKNIGIKLFTVWENQWKNNKKMIENVLLFEFYNLNQPKPT